MCRLCHCASLRRKSDRKSEHRGKRRYFVSPRLPKRIAQASQTQISARISGSIRCWCAPKSPALQKLHSSSGTRSRSRVNLRSAASGLSLIASLIKVICVSGRNEKWTFRVYRLTVLRIDAGYVARRGPSRRPLCARVSFTNTPLFLAWPDDLFFALTCAPRGDLLFLCRLLLCHCISPQLLAVCPTSSSLCVASVCSEPLR